RLTHFKPLVSYRAPRRFRLHLKLHPFLGLLVTLARKSLVFPRLRIEKSDVAARINTKRFKRLAIVRATEEIVSSSDLLIASELEGQHEVGHPDPIDLVCRLLLEKKNFIPVKDVLLGIGWVQPGHQQIDFR